MTVERSGLSRNVDTSSLAGVLAASGRPQAGSTPSGVPLRQLTEPTPEQKFILAETAARTGQDNVLSDWYFGNMPGGKYTREGQPDTYASGITPTGGASGGGGNAGLAQAFRDYIAGVGAGATDFGAAREELLKRFGGYRKQLEDLVAGAGARQETSAARAAEALRNIDPQAAFRFNVSPATIGAGSASDYLKAIGASTAGVEGLRGFEQSLLNQALSGAQQYSAATQQALDTERAARQAAVQQMLQEAQAGLTANQLGAQLGLSESERLALEDLLSRQSSEQQSIADKIFEARLEAAKAGVTL